MSAPHEWPPQYQRLAHCVLLQRLSTNIERLVQRGMGALSAATKRSTSIGSAEQRMALLSSYSGADVRMGDEQIDPAVLQDLISSEDSWRLKQASRPDDILWHNLRNSHKVQAKWGFVTMILVVIIAFFWAIPIALLSSLSVVTIGNFFGSFAKDLAQNYLPALLLVVGDLSVPFLFERTCRAVACVWPSCWRVASHSSDRCSHRKVGASAHDDLAGDVGHAQVPGVHHL